MSSERLRQREVHKYYQSWLESSVGFYDRPTTETTRFHSDGTKFSVSKDTALTSFAQLGCLKLNIKRGIVTLISSSRQYILAEATSSSLLSDGGDDQPIDDIWFGNASIPRSEGISGSALAPPDYTAHSSDGASFTAPALVINDLAKHPDFSSRSYAGNGISFYCGIPIVTKDGNVIGVYSLSDDRPRDGLKPIELRYVCDLASVIMRHLEIVKNEAARFRGESMVLGLGQFIQGASTISSHKSFRPRMPSPPSRLDYGTPPRAHLFKGMTITAADPFALHAVSQSQQEVHYQAATPTPEVVETRDAAQAEQTSGVPPTSPLQHTTHLDASAAKAKGPPPVVNNIFTRAANILRECCGADGVLFFDAVSTNLAKRSSTTGFQSANKVSKGKAREHWTSSAQRALSISSRNSTTADSDDIDSSEGMDSNEEAVSTCTLLGFSVDVTEQTRQRVQELKRLAMTESILRRLIRKYPQGKIFYFSPSGDMSSSENDITASSAASETTTVILKESAGPGENETRSKSFKSKFADELKRLVPQAQSVIWLPMWDFSKQRWSAGAFLWTKMAEQLIVAQDDLVYLKTFANSIMIEVARQDAASADDTKTTFIANISHELRSPLHGVIGSCELLKDTSLDEHQSSLVKAIEMCGKTLNDTIDHVLDYTKINQLMKRGSHLLRPGATKSGRHNVPAVDKSMLEDDFDLAVLIQDAVETVCASQSSQHQRVRDQSSAAIKESNVPSETSDEKAVQVIFKIAHQDSWWVRSQPGAIKRILSNLVQNALKYTDNGTVVVGLSLRSSLFKKHRRGSDEKEANREQDITLTVTDTGRGMSNEFVRNHAFTPFSQESSFSDGTGLGLSIVQLIVDSLGGKIELKSRPDVGTEIKIHLTLPRSTSSEALSENDPRSVKSKVSRKRLCLVCPTIESSMSTCRSFDAAISNIATAWLGINIKRSASFSELPADFYLYIAPPKASDIVSQIRSKPLSANSSIVLFASNASEKLKLRKELEELEQEGVVVEIALHPVGPQKLCEVLNKCLSRQEEAVTTASSIPAETPQSSVNEAQDRDIESDRGNAPIAHHRSVAEEPIRRRDSNACGDMTIDTNYRQSPSHRHNSSVTVHETYLSFQNSVDLKMLASPTATSKQKVDVLVMPQSMSKRILLVDDNAINLNILKAAMKMGKFAFETANDGLEALEAFKQAARAHHGAAKPFTHVLMDINMPVMDGIESTRLIRKFEREQASREDRSRISMRGGYWSDRGKSMEELRRLHSTPILTNHNDIDDNDVAEDNDNDDDDDAPTPSEFAESLPKSPTDHTEIYLASLRSQRTRPLLSAIQIGHEPTRAITYSVNEGEPTPYSYGSLPRTDHHPRAMIIALSGVAFEQTQKDMFAAGADMFFAKPVKLKELIKLLEETPTSTSTPTATGAGGGSGGDGDGVDHSGNESQAIQETQQHT